MNRSMILRTNDSLEMYLENIGSARPILLAWESHAERAIERDGFAQARPGVRAKMHELSLCRSLIRQVQSVAQQRRAQRVVSIVVRVGSLSGVEPVLLQRAYPIASAGTIAEAANLIIESSSLRVKCTQCGAESDADINRLLCAQCGDWRTRVISGDEIFLTSVELESAGETMGDPQYV